MFAGPAFAEPNDGVEGLNEEQQSFAGRFLQFQDDMDEKFFGRAGEINGGHSSDVKETIKDPYADFYVRVARGDVVEKIGRMISRVYDTNRSPTFSVPRRLAVTTALTCTPNLHLWVTFIRLSCCNTILTAPGPWEAR
jgi:hypothetical protein